MISTQQQEPAGHKGIVGHEEIEVSATPGYVVREKSAILQPGANVHTSLQQPGITRHHSNKEEIIRTSSSVVTWPKRRCGCVKEINPPHPKR